ncbi:MAG: bifunctional proline dehydrogenase/L-glutamate gamma-semialdehyde dehydrogenase [Bacteroidales bacterium]
MSQISANEVVAWVRELHHNCEKEITNNEKREQKRYSLLIRNPNEKLFLTKILDESCQIRDNKKLSKRVKLLIEKYGVPKFFNATDRSLMYMFKYVGHHFDFVAMPIFKAKVRHDTSSVIIDEARPNLTKHLAKRRAAGIGQNINLLGEVVLGNAEADNRYNHYLDALTEDDINYISIKISGIYAQIHPLNYLQSKEELVKRVAAIYRQAMEHKYVDQDGIAHHKFVNLDMEEYKDTELTLEVFKSVLSMPEFKNYSAGIVVQAYLPDAWAFQSELLEFAHNRCAQGGAPIKMRLVKGANLQMESVVSSLKHWENPILRSKIEVDANYLRIIDRALKPENAKVLNVGIASHNLFSIGYAFLLSQKNKVQSEVSFEMLEGMANHIWRVLCKMGRQVILYTPVVKSEHFLNAISYLVRRLDENTGRDNFLSYSFNLRVDSVEWDFLEKQFLSAYTEKDKAFPKPFRTQNRNLNSPYERVDTSNFFSEADTNFDLPQQRTWVDEIIKKWKKTPDDTPTTIPVMVGSKEIENNRYHHYIDHSQLEQEVMTYRVSLANRDQVEEILQIAHSDSVGWRDLSLEDRAKILFSVANNISDRRGDLIGCMSAVTGKTIMEGDIEVSEAVDFCRFYPVSMRCFENLQTVSYKSKGVVLVIPPWNFPLAIPVGGVAAALAAGNCVILKPATVAAPIAFEFARCFWEAGVAKEALQVVVCDSRDTLNYLTKDSRIGHIILTGGTDTAMSIANEAPSTALSAETGGKNAIILTSYGDRDKAIQSVVTSAFSNAGQKCSACSLFLVEKDIYNDDSFKSKLYDAVTSIQCGSAWESNNIVGRMVTNHNDKLHKALELQKGEEWLVPPIFLDKEKYTLKPCVKWGVKPGNYTFDNEIFAPVLSVVCIDSLKQGIEYVNSLEYGLTSGLQSLNESEHHEWINSIQAGNLYINRGITGAIVNRQPFGGVKLSCFGAGLKAGGPNYVSSLVNFTNNNLSTKGKHPSIYNEIIELLPKSDYLIFDRAVHSYQQNFNNIFSKAEDINCIMGEMNILRYTPLNNILLRLFGEESILDISLVAVASQIVGTPLIISYDTDESRVDQLEIIANATGAMLHKHDKKALLSNLDEFERVRTCGIRSIELLKSASKIGKYVADQPILIEGRVELLHYIKEQSITYEYHRYGSIQEERVAK